MQKEKLSLGVSSSEAKKEKQIKKRKRKINIITDESGLDITSRPSKLLKLASFTEKSVMPEKTKFLHYKSTSNYAKVVAKPGSLPSAPKIFHISKSKNALKDTSNSFLFNFLSKNSFNTDLNRRFSQRMIKNNKNENKKRKKIKKIKIEASEKKHKNSISNIKTNQKNKVKKQEPTNVMEFYGKNSFESNKSLHKEEKNEISCIDIYKVPLRETFIFHMHHPSKFSFHGEIKITLICGEVEILGYTLSSSSSKNSVDIYSPNFYIPLTVETKFLQQNASGEEIQTKLKDFLSIDDYNALLTKFKSEDSILLVEKITSHFGIVINKYFDKPLFPKDLEDVSSMSESLKSLQSTFTFQLSKNGKHFRKSPQWDKIPLGHCTLLCGGKGVGKSTLLKYYINKLVSLGEKILCLDFDPGQPEFIFPGCVSATVVDQPLLGPNFTHILEPFLMISFGDVDVCPNPSKYLECVKYVIENCRKNEEFLKMKWFVNTMGFCKGLGVDLMITLLKLVKPDTVIQIKGSDHKNNYPFYLTSAALNSRSGFRSMPLDDVNLSYDLKVIHTCAEQNKKQLIGGLKQRQLRDIMCISYFSKVMSPPFYNFNAVQPYLISFSKLYLGIDFFINPSHVLKAFNGNMVSLTHFEPDSEEIFSVESEEDIYFKVVIKPTMVPSLGIGFVRGIDCKERKFYLVTHLPIEALNNVNCLNLGRIGPPHSMFLKQETVDGRTVYTTTGKVVIIHRVKRMFRVPGTSHKREKNIIKGVYH